MPSTWKVEAFKFSCCLFLLCGFSCHLFYTVFVALLLFQLYMRGLLFFSSCGMWKNSASYNRWWLTFDKRSIRCLLRLYYTSSELVYSHCRHSCNKLSVIVTHFFAHSSSVIFKLFCIRINWGVKIMYFCALCSEIMFPWSWVMPRNLHFY